jgi:peptidoglycan/xylan/chitin deacetylase (PgdA/CDA1 family)
MHQYFIKTPWIVKQFFPNYIWSMPVHDHSIYLTFDDGPHPAITPWVLDELKKYNALATFFCIGKNVLQYPQIYQRILAEGHSVGNHTHSHLNGWKTGALLYVKDVAEAAKCIDSDLFRPPYGKIKKKQAEGLTTALKVRKAKIVMWDVLSADFDKTISPEQCLKNVVENASTGSIVVFHDSEKASTNLLHVLPEILQLFSKKGCLFKNIAYKKAIQAL